MRKKKNTLAKIMASIALAAIVIGIVGTGIIFIFTATTSAPSEQELNQEQIDAIIEQFSGSIDTAIESSSGALGEVPEVQ